LLRRKIKVTDLFELFTGTACAMDELRALGAHERILMTTLMLALVLSLAIGLSLGLLGGGGSILTVPILVYALGMEAKSAIATSLLVVGVTSAAAMVPHALAGRVQMRTGLVFGTAGMVGAYVAGRFAHFIPATVLLIAFALMMLVTAIAMMRGRKDASGGPAVAPKHLPVFKVVAEGLLVGAATGLVGAGGGFLVVPALVLLGGLPMTTAVGTSLVVISMKSIAGFFGYLGHVNIDWTVAVLVTVMAVVGSLAGSRLAGRIPQDRLRKGFAWFVVAMGVFMLVKQVPDVLDERTLSVVVSILPYALVAVMTPLAYYVGSKRCSEASLRPPSA
jgi:uncharacterized membrane protein YfcA